MGRRKRNNSKREKNRFKGDILYGRNVARESLRARRRHIHEVLIAENIEPAPIIKEIVNLAHRIRVPVYQTSRHQLDNLTSEHQGVILKTGQYPLVDIEDILLKAEKKEEPPFLLALDHLDNPHNLGAILRTAEAVGVHGVLIPKQRAVGVTPAVVRASAGAAEHIWVAQVSNLVQSFKTLKKSNIWVVGVEKSDQAQLYVEADLKGAILLVIGSEGQGLGRLVAENCDFVVKLPMQGQIESLNASVAAGLMLYEVWRARNFAPL